jgi:tetratricopeptide (TPR) repeat protein
MAGMEKLAGFRLKQVLLGKDGIHLVNPVYPVAVCFGLRPEPRREYNRLGLSPSLPRLLRCSSPQPTLLKGFLMHVMNPLCCSFALALIVAPSAHTFAGDAPAGSRGIPLLQGLGSHTRAVTTKSPQAQKYFDQGLNLVFGFAHGAAIRSFQEAARLDPECAMAHWGVALASGPHINFPMVPPPMAEQAWAELQLAQKHAATAKPADRALIEALSKRYVQSQPEDRSPLDRAYADAMRAVWKAYPKDADIGALFAEAMMDLRPWDQWTPEGVAQPGTDEIIGTLDAVIKLDPKNPFANHLYIHAVEASPRPERALAAADRLRDLQPGLPHNVHMPSHIDIRVGDWHKAIQSNVKAVEADRRYRQVLGPPQDMIIVYAAHNGHMLAYAAMMTGQRELAMKHIRAMVAGVPEDFLKENAMMVEGFVAMPYEVMVRFGMWDEILSAPDHPDYMVLTRALRLAARGIAHSAKGDVKAARREQAAYLEACKRVPAEETLGNNTGQGILAVATPMLEGEILVREGKVDEGIVRLREAIKAEDVLKYDEPPGWILPVRHALGATLINAGRFGAAEEVYREDLKRLPENGWSLFGLARSLKLQNKGAESAEVEKRFKKVWRSADLQLTSSCLCQPGK